MYRTRPTLVALAVAVTAVGLAGCGIIKPGSSNPTPGTWTPPSTSTSTSPSASTPTSAKVNIGDETVIGYFGQTTTATCEAGKSLNITGANNTLTITGPCETVTVSGLLEHGDVRRTENRGNGHRLREQAHVQDRRTQGQQLRKQQHHSEGFLALAHNTVCTMCSTSWRAAAQLSPPLRY